MSQPSSPASPPGRPEGAGSSGPAPEGETERTLRLEEPDLPPPGEEGALPTLRLEEPDLPPPPEEPGLPTLRLEEPGPAPLDPSDALPTLRLEEPDLPPSATADLRGSRRVHEDPLEADPGRTVHLPEPALPPSGAPGAADLTVRLDGGPVEPPGAPTLVDLPSRPPVPGAGETVLDLGFGSSPGSRPAPPPPAPTAASGGGQLRSAREGGGSLRSRSTRAQRAGGREPTEGAVFAGKYELLHEIARGGMGVVYKARQIDLNRIVALKVMLSGVHASETERRRFLIEAEASARLKHPHIIAVHDIGEEGGNLFFTMDFVEGKPLSERKKELTRDQLMQVMLQVCDGVAFAHQRGIIHRDLKPANIMMAAGDLPMIMDFGLAKQVSMTEEDGQPSLKTREGAVMGTPHYMPPEQAEGLISEIDIRSDVYALGVILYELLTRELPFQGRGINELLRKIFEEDPRPPRQLDATIDPDLEAIVLKALEKDKARRYDSASELKRDLERVRDGLPVSARRATILYRARKWGRRNRVAIAGSVLLLAVVAGFSGYLVHQARAAERAARAERLGRVAEARTAVDALEARGRAQAQALAELDGAPPAPGPQPPELLAGREARTATLLGQVEQLQREVTGALAPLLPIKDELARGGDEQLAALLELERRFEALGRDLEAQRQRLIERQAGGGGLRGAAEHLAGADEAARRATAALTGAAQGGPATDEGATPDLASAVSAGEAVLRGLREADPAVALGADYARHHDDLLSLVDAARRRLYAAMGQLREASPEGAFIQAELERAARLVAEVDGLERGAASRRRALRALGAARAIVSHLPRGEALRRSEAEGDPERGLFTARVCQELARQALEQAAADPALRAQAAEARHDANRIQAETLLAIQAYPILAVELQAEDAFRPEDRAWLEEQRSIKLGKRLQLQQAIERLGAVDPAATPATLERQLADLERLADDPLLDEDLRSKRERGAAQVQARLRDLRATEAELEVQGALDAARVVAARLLEGQALPAGLGEGLQAWDEVARRRDRHAALLDPRFGREVTLRCDEGRAALYRAAATRAEQLRRYDEALAALTPLLALHEEERVASDERTLAALREDVERLRRLQGAPPGTVFFPARERVELGGGPEDRNPLRTVDRLAAFYLAEREVTNREYQEFVAAGGYISPELARHWPAGCDPRGFTERGGDGLPGPLGWRDGRPPAGQEDLPVSGISWYEARAYASYRGMRLPRDSEWELVARYDGGRHRYPWGDAWEPGLLGAVLRPAGSTRDRTPGGIVDMGGNVSEWVEVVGEAGEVAAAARGASFLYPLERIARATHRLRPRPDYRGPQLGLRLAKDAR